MMKSIPGVKTFARISTEGVGYLAYKKEPLKVEDIHHADPSLLDIFSFPTEKLFHVNGTPRENFQPTIAVDILKKSKNEDYILEEGLKYISTYLLTPRPGTKKILPNIKLRPITF